MMSIGFCASSFTDNFWLFFFMFSVIGGLGSAISYHCSVLVVLNHFEKWLSLAVGITASSSSVGMFIVTRITNSLISETFLKQSPVGPLPALGRGPHRSSWISVKRSTALIMIFTEGSFQLR